MSLARFVSETSTNRPRIVLGIIALTALVLALLAALPSIWPGQFSALNPLQVDTDPENMLSPEEPVRIFHNRMKEKFDLNDIIVVGVVNEEHPQGVFNKDSLERVYQLTEYAKTLQGEAVGSEDPRGGVVRADIIAPSTVDNIEQGGVGTVRFEWLMSEPPENQKEALAVRDKAQNIPFLNGTLVSEDGQALALYLPITSKDLSYEVWAKLKDKINGFQGNEQWHITGLPVANDVFGVQMFKQMAISAPLAMLVIFLLMLYFFRNLLLIISPMLVAMASVILTMSALIISGNTIHIMSSMIPIFIMPIAVLDSIHILSEFFDHYQRMRDRVRTIKYTLETLFLPMLFTSVTSAAGFASLALTPIPPVQVFGIFVALGILVAWALTIVLIPAYIMFIPEHRLENFGMQTRGSDASSEAGLLGRFLQFIGSSTYRRGKVYLSITAVLVIIAIYGITQIVINDNPTKWFKKDHSIRVADQVLNDHFGGTYMAYLNLEPQAKSFSPRQYTADLQKRLQIFVQEEALEPATPKLADELAAKVKDLTPDAAGREGLLSGLQDFIQNRLEAASGEAVYAWEELQRFLDQEQSRDDVFKDPKVLKYMASLEEALLETGIVGKSNSLTDIVKTVHRELFEGRAEAFKIPDSARAVAQTLVTYQSSHRPQDLWHFVTPDYRQASLWVQLKSGDNRDMTRVVEAVDQFLKKNPPPADLQAEWFGLTYINVVWQSKMVSGMLKAFLGSFLVVLLMMTLLFRSALWGLLSMVPLTVTIGFIYGAIGLAGKNYDMPVAVLSSLTIGLAVDFAIHFLVRARVLQAEQGQWQNTVSRVFGEPARAISRNVVVIALGFTPLLLAPLLPYVTVGFFMASIMLVSGAATLILLPSIIPYLEPLLFPRSRGLSLLCKGGTCFISGLAALALVLINIQQFLRAGWTAWTWISLGALPLLFLFCAFMSRRAACWKEEG
ncbi:MAG: MMPL family transporter [Desulfohalobiaceae bacterium]|nr:MMPL family transporter [Desulfohalobiaceae bacterium]